MTDSTNALVPFDFHGDWLEVFVDGQEVVWVAVRPFCNALGLDRKTQQRKLRKVGWARENTIVLPDATGRLRHTFMVGLDSVQPWLGSARAGRVNPALRPKLLLFQLEAVRTLRDRFSPMSLRAAQDRAAISAQARREREEIRAQGRRRREEIKTLARRKIEELQRIRNLPCFDQLSPDFLTMVILHAVALVDGTLPLPHPRVVDVSSFLEGKGLDRRDVRRFASPFGKRLRVLFERKHGKAPGKALRDIAGEERLVNCYTEVDLPLFEEAFRELFPTMGDKLDPELAA
jgi:hypothetical protein